MTASDTSTESRDRRGDHLRGPDDPSESDLAEYTRALSHFGERIKDVLFATGTESGPDGDLSAVPTILAEGRSMGLLADPSTHEPDQDFGVWGSSTSVLGDRLSLISLSLLAETCAGIAAAVHAQGLGCLALDGHTFDGGSAGSNSTVAAAFIPEVGTTLDERARPAAIAASFDTAGGAEGAGDIQLGGTLDGHSDFVWSAGPPEQLVVFGWTGTQWVVVVVPTDARGVTLQQCEARVGLRAVHHFGIMLNSVHFDAGDVVATGERAESIVSRTCASDWLGVSAIGLGTGRAALREATIYASDRRQGGRAISDHAAVRLLLAEASHDLSLLDSTIESAAGSTAASDADRLQQAISARLALSTHGFNAVSNCMQVLGGYGYMDDYGISKRLRDVSALRTRNGSREQLLLLSAQLRSGLSDPLGFDR